VYVAIADVLEERIRGGTYPPEGRLPTELELVSEVGAARETVRQVVSEV
jgi:DNA-binding GntR family transcriptional regulator